MLWGVLVKGKKNVGQSFPSGSVLRGLLLCLDVEKKSPVDMKISD
jgi:hypothetical protein